MTTTLSLQSILDSENCLDCARSLESTATFFITFTVAVLECLPQLGCDGASEQCRQSCIPPQGLSLWSLQLVPTSLQLCILSAQCWLENDFWLWFRAVLECYCRTFLATSSSYVRLLARLAGVAGTELSFPDCRYWLRWIRLLRLRGPASPSVPLCPSADYSRVWLASGHWT